MPELASGVVTFLFSDIEGSTRLLKDLGRERYGQLLVDHQRLMRDTFEEADGEEIDTQGDAFFAAFRSATDAIAAAVAAQRAHADHDWPDGVQLRVRIGIHTGEASISGERIHGLGVHRAARICAAGHGGQVLVSQTTHDLLADEERALPDSILRDLGVHALKDLDRPVRIYQLDVDGLEQRFPRLRTEAPGWRGRLSSTRMRVVAAAVAAAVVAAVVAVVLALRSGGGSVPVRANSVAVIDPGSGHIVGDLPVGTSPHRIFVSARRGVVINGGDRTVAELDTESYRVSRTFGLTDPEDLWVDGGTVWVDEPSVGKVARIDPDGTTTEIKVWPGGTAYANDGTITAAAGRVWVSHGAVIDEISQATNKVTRRFRLPSPDTTPDETVLSLKYAAGRLWTEREKDQTLGWIDLSSGDLVPVYKLPVGYGVEGWDVGYGSFWVSNTDESAGEGWLTGISQANGAVVVKTKTGALGGGGVQTGEKAVWVLDPSAGKLVQLDMKGERVVRTIDLGHELCCVSVGQGRVWVTARSELPKQ